MAAEELDLLIVVGGVVGAGAGLDVTRGLSVGILEARDWASGTSSRSSKLIHGGLRYLEMFDFRLVREALKEREDYLAAEVVYAASHEGARPLDDVLTRRTRISIETWDRGVSAASGAAALMAVVLGWSHEQEAREIEHYLARVEAERLSQQQPDDESADRVRMRTSEIVPLA
jgi:glycerol-3-phosphate dehydrogenase